MPDPTKQKEILENLCENIKVQLEKRVNELLNRGDCGIATAIGFLGMLLSQINLFLEEMNEELILFTEKIQKDESNKKVSQQDLAEEFHHFRLFSSKKKDYFEDLMDSCDELAKDTIEKDRRNYAIQFFNSLKGDISTLELKLSQLKNTVKAVYSSLTNELSAIQNQYNRANPITEINLAEGMLNNVFVKDDDLLMNEFV